MTMEQLAEYIRAGARRRAHVLPCAPWACDWVLLRIGVDPIADLRDRWTTSTIRRRIRAEGGLEAMARARFAAAGLAETDDPAPGDVGIVRGGHGPTLAIRTTGGWAGPGPGRGVTLGPFPVLAAWSVPCLR